MDFKSIFDSINKENQYLIIPNSLNMRIVKKKSELEITNKSLYKFKILTESEAIDLFSFKVNNELLLYQLQENHLPISITKDKIKFSKYNFKNLNIDLSKFFDESKGFFITNELFKKHISDYQFSLLVSDIYLKPFFDFYNIKYQTIELKPEKNPVFHKFSSKKDELFYLFESISKKLKNGFNINKIFLANIDNTYYVDILKIARFYNIPINLSISYTLNDLSYIREIMSFEFNEIIKILSDNGYRNEYFHDIRKIDEQRFDDAINKLINVFNKYPLNKYENKYLIKLINEDLKTTKIKTSKLKNALNIISLDEIIGLNDDELVYILNARYEAFPKIAKDNDYLADNDKELIGYPTSTEINISNNDYLEKIIKIKEIEYVSYHEKDKYNQFTPSDIVTKYFDVNQKYSKITIDDLENAFAKEYYKSSFESRESDVLLTSFTGEFKLTEQEKNHLSQYIKLKKIVLTPTAITTYFKIPFIYYIEKILGLDTFTERVDILLGNYFHALIEALMKIKYQDKVVSDLKFKNTYINEYIKSYKEEEIDYSKYFDDFFNLYFKDENELINELKLKNINDLNEHERLIIKTNFFIKKNKKMIVKALKQLIDLEDYEGSKELLVEYEADQKDFTGRADIVKMYEDNTFGVIDYKLGNKEAFHYEKLVDVFKSLLNPLNDEVSLSSLSLLQLIFYGYFVYKKTNKKLKYISFYSYFDDGLKLNALSNVELDKNYFKTGKDRIISDTNVDELYGLTKDLLNLALESIYDANFPIKVRKDVKRTDDLEDGIYSIYEALAFYNTNIESSDENDD
ncbi:PD-(D/E)XK nuclease family protein [Haploplasma axanthum]|uniref:Inactivated superfamily I helicase n=1 Tax=Haploplasma axanthum TaxID=29552 RepID=A0A449BE66_HAPAX|nr:PD-(D/E)XK nuclease family protein [Haploplasma axanthum]VEU80600.1 Inactivated superfamily I helicase [Haploplasma axanthum]